MPAELGDKIRRARERKRMTQEALARELGVHRRTVDNWENGRSSPRNRTGALEEVLGISLGPKPHPEKEANEDPHARLDRLYEEWKSDPSRRARLTAIFEEGEGADSDSEISDDDEDPHDRLERLWREYKNDQGERGEVLRTLLEKWGERDIG